MGFHICEYGGSEAHGKYPTSSSGDVRLTFDSGRIWIMPDMILHYVADHHWLPPEDFIHDIMHATYVVGKRSQTKSPAPPPIPVGYVKGEFVSGDVPEGFVEKLQSLMQAAADNSHRIQYRGISESY
jgi:hypothetical protein